jgi:hypothetical protein
MLILCITSFIPIVIPLSLVEILWLTLCTQSSRLHDLCFFFSCDPSILLLNLHIDTNYVITNCTFGHQNLDTKNILRINHNIFLLVLSVTRILFNINLKTTKATNYWTQNVTILSDLLPFLSISHKPRNLSTLVVSFFCTSYIRQAFPSYTNLECHVWDVHKKHKCFHVKCAFTEIWRVWINLEKFSI